MKLPARMLRLLPPVLLSLTGLITLLQILAFLLDYEAPAANYFSVGAILPTIANVLTVLVVLAGCLLALLIPKNQLQLGTLPVRAASIPAAVGFLAGAVILLLSLNSTASRFAVLFLLLGAAYALLSGYAPARMSATSALLGFAAVLGCILLDALYYFDSSLEMNAPVKVTVIIGLLCAMLYYTGEIRILLGKPAPRLYMMLCFWLLGAGGLAALPIPIAALAGAFARTTSPSNAPVLAQQMYHPEYLAGALIVLGTAISAGIRLWSWLRQGAVPSAAEAPVGASEAGPSAGPGEGER